MFPNLVLSRACLFTLILTLVQHVGITEANHERVCDYRSRPHDNGLCGSNLADMLRLLCSMNSNHFTKYIVKRQTEKSLDDSLRNIMLNKKDALSYLAKRETSGSIICECCYHQCHVMELLQYCDLPSVITNYGGRQANNRRAALTS
ncbi:unnamed protein product [Candidula unifasciata]|uniref:Insulin-like domain-containing protein n=1 Tax=Candidula unifasciata TaxID=100452 RepID=A0A8S4A769_9EUPU|nr:unnamed protein product [Candidula unifasciata]